ncbi:MAG TPA: GTPase [Phycisphaerae bacterium]|nr:GTPase [Phycisphaerae bacterium]
MAINATPQYKKAEDRYRAASQGPERVAALEEMLRLVPKHKASEKLQQQIKQKLKTARDELQRAPKSGGQTHDIFNVPSQGAGQVVLLGAPNVGKSSIIGALTNAKVEIAEFPFSTHAAVPGMAHHEDVPIQLVDMPPMMEGQAQGGMLHALRRADVILIVVDLAAIELIDQFEQAVNLLKAQRMQAGSVVSIADAEEDDIEKRDLDALETAVMAKRVLVVANKIDVSGAKDNFDTFKEMVGSDLKMRPVSAKSGEGLKEMLADLFELLDVVRVYAKKPGKPADKEAPFILPVGSTVQDMAEHIHHELAAKLKTARIWGGTVHDGQQVTGGHVLTDQNVVELHV